MKLNVLVSLTVSGLLIPTWCKYNSIDVNYIRASFARTGFIVSEGSYLHYECSDLNVSNIH